MGESVERGWGELKAYTGALRQINSTEFERLGCGSTKDDGVQIISPSRRLRSVVKPEARLLRLECHLTMEGTASTATPGLATNLMPVSNLDLLPFSIMWASRGPFNGGACQNGCQEHVVLLKLHQRAGDDTGHLPLSGIHLTQLTGRILTVQSVHKM